MCIYNMAFKLRRAKIKGVGFESGPVKKQGSQGLEEEPHIYRPSEGTNAWILKWYLSVDSIQFKVYDI